MSASSSRIGLIPPDESRRLGDRAIDRVLGWWDTGGGRHLRRSMRSLVSAGTLRVKSTLAPLADRPFVARAVHGWSATCAWIAKAFASDLPPTPPTPPSDRRVTRATAVVDEAPASAPVLAPIVPPTASDIPRPRTSPSITRPMLAAVTAAEPATNAMTTLLRCWHCLQRHRVRTPRRGGCFHCGSCQAVMLVVDPIVGLTCAVEQARERGIRREREADETDPAGTPA